VDYAHPLFEEMEVLDEQPPYDGALMERLGVRGLHMGCGGYVLRRWLNTDLRLLKDAGGNVPPAGRIVRGHRSRYYLSHDALGSYPIEDGSFDVAFSEHFVEHVRRDEAIAWLREVRRLLRPGGFLRLSTPDLRRYVDGYLDPAGSFFAEHREILRNMPRVQETGVLISDTRAFMMNQIFRFFGHQWLYDVEEIRYVAAEAGFGADAVTECSFRTGRLAAVADLDQEFHRDESLFVEIARA
jgi:predicted SAM-dependent methyltransferase